MFATMSWSEIRQGLFSLRNSKYTLATAVTDLSSYPTLAYLSRHILTPMLYVVEYNVHCTIILTVLVEDTKIETEILSEAHKKVSKRPQVYPFVLIIYDRQKLKKTGFTIFILKIRIESCQ